MQEQLAKAQEEAANEVVEASAGGGMVTVKANGAGEVVAIAIDPKAIDPDDPDLLADLVLAAVSEALPLDTLTIRPAGASRSSGSIACVTAMTPNTLVSNTARTSPSDATLARPVLTISANDRSPVPA